jgi:acetyl esterase/lipase
MPLYPMVDDTNETASSYEINSKTMPKAWNRENNLTAWHMYLGDHIFGEIPAYAAPARAEDLTGLPPAYICIGQLDPFRDETIHYVARLAQAGVPVEFHIYPGCFHGFDAIMNKTEICVKVRNEYVAAAKKAFYEAAK